MRCVYVSMQVGVREWKEGDDTCRGLIVVLEEDEK